MIGFRAAVFALLALVGFQACDKGPSGRAARPAEIAEQELANPDEVVAAVNGVPISKRQIREIVDSRDSGLDVDEALEIAIRNELLAQEAQRRGYGLEKEVEHAKGTELARLALKTQIGQEINAGTLDMDKLKKLYEANKRRFVHGVLRTVVHIVLMVGEKHFSEKEASSLSGEIAERAQKTKTEGEFTALCESYLEKNKDSVKIEKLPPFDAASDQFVKEFVDATFAVPGVGQSSPPVRTKFGWHVFFVVEEQPPENRSFEDVKAELSEMVLPFERELKAKELMEGLEKNGKVFIYEEPLRDDLETQ